MVKNTPANAGDTGLIPGLEIKILHAMDKLRPPTATSKACKFWSSHIAARESLHAAMKSPWVELKTQRTVKNNKQINVIV